MIWRRARAAPSYCLLCPDLLVARLYRSTTPASATTGDVGEGTHADFVCGLSLGFFLGLLMVFVLWELRMSRQQRLGTVLINLPCMTGIYHIHGSRICAAARTSAA